MLGAIASLFGTVANNNANRNIAEEDRRFQQQENEKARQYNLMLAKYQNAENVAQWRRESNFNEQMMDKQNAYSSPAAQMSRYAAAGLNPNLIYGQSNVSAGINGSSAAGSMTGGASSPVADAAATSERHGRQSYSTALGEVGKGLMNLPLYREEVRKMQLENEEREQNIIKQKFDNAFEQFLQEVDPQADFQTISETSMNLLGSLKGRQAIETWNRQHKENQELDERIKQAMFNNRLNNASYNHYIKQIASEAQISFENARWLADTFTMRMLGLKHGTSLLEKQDNWFNYEKAIGVSGNVISSLADCYSSLNPPKAVKNYTTNIFNRK